VAIDTQAFRLLLAARKAGVDFTRTVTFGRQSFYPKPRHAARALAAADLGIGLAQLGELRHRYSEAFLSALGAQTVDSIDASNYEGATVVHDLNEPLPASLAGTCTLVFDGGTTEHIFNYPQALTNAIRLLRTGGHFISLTAANNLSGHGFYQISPELFFRVFSRANGFEIRFVLLAEARPGGRFFRVADPGVLRRRIEFVTRRPLLVAVAAKKIAAADSIRVTPQQSDYQAAWREAAEAAQSPRFGRELRRLFRQFRTGIGGRLHLPWQTAGISALSDEQLYSLGMSETP
jgi:SAM-dependent methyltransferase